MNDSNDFPQPVSGILDDKMWKTIDNGAMELPYCEKCRKAVYPPANCCPHCFEFDLPWKKICGKGKILSWTKFHRSYLPQYPAPYNIIAVQMDEGFVFVSNLVASKPVSDGWIGRKVNIVYQSFNGKMLPRFELIKEEL